MIFQSIQYVTTGFSLVAFVAALVLLGFRAWLRTKAAAIDTAPQDKKKEIVSIINEWVPVDLPSLSPETRDQVAVLQVKMRARRDLITALLLFSFAAVAGIVTVLISSSSSPVKPIIRDKDAQFAENPNYKVNSFVYQAADPDYIGPRFWKRVTPDTFFESKSKDDTTEGNFFDVVRRINYAGCDGIIVEKKHSPTLQLFIPERNCPYMELKFRRLPSTDWIDLKMMQDVN